MESCAKRHRNLKCTETSSTFPRHSSFGLTRWNDPPRLHPCFHLAQSPGLESTFALVPGVKFLEKSLFVDFLTGGQQIVPGRVESRYNLRLICIQSYEALNQVVDVRGKWP